MNMAKRPVQKIDFDPYGAAIKAARTGQKESRNKVGDEMYLSPRYLANIENKGQHPSLQIFFELMSRYHISVDQLLFGDTADGKSTALLAAWHPGRWIGPIGRSGIIIATVQAVLGAREKGE